MKVDDVGDEDGCSVGMARTDGGFEGESGVLGRLGVAEHDGGGIEGSGIYFAVCADGS